MILGPSLRPPPGRSGRVRVAPWAVTALAVVVSFSLARWYQRTIPERRGTSQRTTAQLAAPRPTHRVDSRAGEVLLEDGTEIAVRIAPLLSEGEDERFRAVALEDRWDLPDYGDLFRAIVSVAGTERAFQLRELGIDVDLVPLRTLIGEERRAADPLLTLYTRETVELAAGAPQQIAFFGTLPRAGTRCTLDLVGLGEVQVELEEVSLDTRELPRSFAGLAGVDHDRARDRRIAELEARVHDLEDALAESRRQHVQFVQGVAALESLAVPAPEPAPEPEEVREEPSEEGLEAAGRAGEIQAALTALLGLTGHHGLDLLHVGELLPEERAVGPVLFRLLDGRGRLSGTLAAERLRMEASRASRTLTIVLEDGYEGHKGERVDFESGVRRIPLEVDPEDFVTRFPELFSESDVDPLEDDGMWVHSEVRAILNELLGADTESAWFRVHSFAGIRDGELVLVHLEEFDRVGHIKRRLFADRMRIVLAAESVVLVLEDGAYVRGEEREPFADGKHEIHIVHAELARWRSARLPGIHDPAGE